jgi:hypothetical protein
MAQSVAVVLDIWDNPVNWKCSFTKPCSSKRSGIGKPHENCIFKGFCSYQFYVAAGQVEEASS